MNDAQRLDWLERNPDRLVVHRWGDKHKFSIQVEQAQHIIGSLAMDYGPAKYSREYDTLREALDEEMKRIL